MAISACTNACGMWPPDALRKKRPVAGWPRICSAYAVNRSQRGRSSGAGRRPSRELPSVASMFSPSTRTKVRRSLTRSASSDCREDDDLVAVLELGLEATDEADVLVVDVDVDEAAQVAVLEQAVLDAGVVGLEVVDQGGQAGALAVDRLLPVRVGAQDGRDPDLDGHGLLLSCSRCVVRARRPR